MVRSSRSRLIAHRLRAHGLAGPLGDTAEDVVRRYGAMQGEKYLFTCWSIALRASGVDQLAIDRALAAGTVLRTHLLRPTWHLVLREDIRWLQRLCGPRVQAQHASRFKELGLDARTLRRCETIITRALESGHHLTRAELGAVFGEAGIDVAGQRLPHILLHAELVCLICSGVPTAKDVTFALFDERATKDVRFEGEEALGELARRYFTAHGPASERDFRWWSSLRAADAKRAIAAAGSAIEGIEWEGRMYWLAPEDTLPPTGRSPSVYLLPVLDQYMIAYTDSRTLVFDDATVGSSAFGAGNLFHWIVQGGKVIGRWRMLRERTHLDLELSTFRSVTPAIRSSMERAAQNLGLFFHQPVEVRTRIQQLA